MVFTDRLPAPLDTSWDWQLLAACRGLPSSTFFHPDGEREPSRGRRVERARAVCRGCPVREVCLEYSLQAEEPYGTWGGVGERERFAMLRHRRRLARRAAAASEARPGSDHDARGA